MQARSRSTVASCILVAVLVACGGAPPPLEPAPDVAATVLSSGPGPMVVSLLLLDLSTVAAPTAVVELQGGLYSAAVAEVAADGTIELTLPDPDEVPAAVLAPADGFLYNLDGVADCDLIVDVPAARVSGHVFNFVSISGLWGVGTPGLLTTVVGDAAFDLAAATDADAYGGRRIVTWLFADRDVGIASSGAGCAAAPSFAVDVDLQLVAGWNQVAWTIDATATAASLGPDATEELVVSTGAAY